MKKLTILAALVFAGAMLVGCSSETPGDGEIKNRAADAKEGKTNTGETIKTEVTK